MSLQTERTQVRLLPSVNSITLPTAFIYTPLFHCNINTNIFKNLMKMGIRTTDLWCRKEPSTNCLNDTYSRSSIIDENNIKIKLIFAVAIGNKNTILRVTIAHWFHFHIPSFGPGFKSNLHNQCFLVI